MRVGEPRAIYVPIFDSFFESSIMNEAVVTRFVFLALVRLAWRPRSNGLIDVDPRIFAASINIPYDEVETAIHRLMEPDPESGSKLEEGRRVVALDPERPMRGWRLVNWGDYKRLLHTANDKVRKANQRSRDKTGQSGQNVHVTHDTIRDKTKQDKEKRERERFAPPSLEEVLEYGKEIPGLNAEAFFDFYASKGWKVGTSPMKDWRAAARKWRRKDIEDGRVKPSAPAKSNHQAQSDAEAYQNAMKEIAEMEENRRKHGL